MIISLDPQNQIQKWIFVRWNTHWFELERDVFITLNSICFSVNFSGNLGWFVTNSSIVGPNQNIVLPRRYELL
jgi:hypothetical protein